MTATDLDAAADARSATQPLVWPWAVLCAGLFALLVPLALALLGVPDRFYLAMTIACIPLGFGLSLLLGRRPVLRVGLLAGSVLVAAAWATAAYIDNVHRWGRRAPADAVLPWGVSDLPEWAVAAQPAVLAGSIVLAIVALVRLQRSTLKRSGWWTAALIVALALSFLAGVFTLAMRVFAM
jgi:hypothetical protein